jgi:hypothetical protein
MTAARRRAQHRRIYRPDIPAEAAAARQHMRKWVQLMRRHDARLAALSDDEIERALECI